MRLVPQARPRRSKTGMSSSTLYLAAVLLALLTFSIPLSAQTTTKPAAKAPRGSISGRVTIKDRGVPGIAIGVRKGDVLTPFQPYQKTTTDQDGYYRISNLAAGSYTVGASAPAFVIADAKDSGKNKSVLVGEDENVEGINFSLVRGCVITGRVTDTDGRPVIEQQVNIYPGELPDPRTQQQAFFAIASAQTDDRGIYRAFGLKAGRYKVGVGTSDDDSSSNFRELGKASYRQVFYPDASDQTKATIIAVREGSEATNIDITVGRAAQTFSVSGQLVDESGQPVPSLRFGLQRLVGDRIEFTDRFEFANSRGEFVVEGLVPGKYAVTLIANPNSEQRADAVTFDVVDHDVTGVTVKIVKGATITGAVVLESEDKAILAQLLQLQLRAIGASSMGGGATINASSVSPLGPDGSFRVSGLPAGTISFFLSSTGSPVPPKGFMISRIERDGVPSTPRLEIKEGEQVMGVRIFVTVGSATLRGVIAVENGSLPQRGRIFIRLSKTGEQFSNLRPISIDERGHFQMEGLAAGTYDLTVVIADPGQATRNIKREVTLQDGQTTEITIKVDLSKPEGPQ